MPLNIIEGTWEDIEHRKADLIGRRLRVMIQPEKSSRTEIPIQTALKKHSSALGKYAFVSGGSEEFARDKQAEIEREDRKRP